MYKESPLLKRYRNGNYTVRIYEDGTKERFTPEDEFKPEFPESIDLKITDRCDLLCPMCHESSSPDGEEGDLSLHFLYSLPEGMELAIGGGNPLSHPGLVDFLKEEKRRGVIANLTINETHLLLHAPFVSSLIEQGLIHGLGISLNRFDERTFDFASSHPNCIFHMILGLVKPGDLNRIPQGYKALFLGYKQVGRGKEYYQEGIEENIRAFEKSFLSFKDRFEVIAFDNLALRQLNMKKHLPPRLFEKYFMGEDGQMTMYVDLVKKEFAVSSTSSIRYPLLDDIRSMFKFLQKEENR